MARRRERCVRDIEPGAGGSFLSGLVDFGGLLYFAGDFPYELWRTDDTAVGTARAISAVKKHLNVLEGSRLISVHKKGRERINRLSPAALKPATDWLMHFDRFWNSRLTKLQ